MTDYSAALKQLAEPRPRGEKMNHSVERAARLAGFEYWRAFNIWYRKARRIEAHEADAIRDAIQKKNEEDARNEYQELRTRLLKMESRLASEGSDSHREAFAQMRPRFR